MSTLSQSFVFSLKWLRIMVVFSKIPCLFHRQTNEKKVMDSPLKSMNGFFWFFESFVRKINSILHRLTKSFSKSKFFIKATKNMVNSLSANAFPRQSRFPTPNGKNFPLLTLLLPMYFPLESKKRSGINSCAVSPHIFMFRI